MQTGGKGGRGGTPPWNKHHSHSWRQPPRCCMHLHRATCTPLLIYSQVNLVLTSPDASLAEASALMDGPPSIEGLPVVAADGKLVGVLSRKDFAKAGTHVKVRVGVRHILP